MRLMFVSTSLPAGLRPSVSDVIHSKQQRYPEGWWAGQPAIILPGAPPDSSHFKTQPPPQTKIPARPERPPEHAFHAFNIPGTNQHAIGPKPFNPHAQVVGGPARTEPSGISPEVV